MNKIFHRPHLAGIITLLTAILMIFAGAIATSGRMKWLEREDSAEEALPPVITHAPDGSLTVNTTAPGKGKTGFAGDVPLLITLREGKITSIEALPNAETPSFFAKASENIFPRYIGLTPEEALKVSQDAVSGATYSSHALLANINAGLAELSSESYTSTSPWLSLSFWIGLVVVVCGAVIPLFVKSAAYRIVQKIANVAVLGFWTGTFLSFTYFLRTASEGLEFEPSLAMVIMLLCAFIYPLFGRPNHYCLWICPFGSLQDLAAECFPKLHLHIGGKTVRILNTFRKVLWLVLMLLLWTGIWQTWTDYELFSAFLLSSVSTGVIIAASAFILISFFIPRPYCRFVCPTGSLFKYSENEKN